MDEILEGFLNAKRKKKKREMQTDRQEIAAIVALGISPGHI